MSALEKAIRELRRRADVTPFGAPLLLWARPPRRPPDEPNPLLTQNQGDCEICGRWSGDLVIGVCEPCRRRYGTQPA